MATDAKTIPPAVFQKRAGGKKYSGPYECTYTFIWP